MNRVPGRHADRHAIVTGGGSGIGRAIALRLAAEGMNVALLGRRREPLEETSALGAELSGELCALPADVREMDSVQGAVAEATRRFGPVHAAIANAGVGGPNGPGHQPSDEVDRFTDLVATNLSGTYHTFRAALDHLAPDGGIGRNLVGIASVLARIGVPGYTGYCAAKTGITGLVRAFAAELGPRAIQVNAVAPGWVDTEMAWEGIQGFADQTGLSRQAAHDEAMKAVPMGRMGTPDEVAGLVAWLISGDAAGVTGHTLDVNCGSFMS